MGTDKPLAAYVDDYDEEDKLVRGTRRTASKTSKPKKPSDDGYRSQRKSSKAEAASFPSLALESGEISPLRVEVVEKSSKSSKSERRKSTTSAPSPRKATSRPPPTHRNKTFPIQKLDTNLPVRTKNDPSYYGVSPDGTPVYTQTSSAATSRPPSTYQTRRPQSYYGPGAIPVTYGRPPPSRSAFWATPSPIGASYPPQSPYAPLPSYFSAPTRDRLADRFQRQDPITRTSSAAGIRPVTQDYFDRFDADSIRRSKEAEDAAAMPPPPVIPVRRQSVAVEPRGIPSAFKFDFDDEDESEVRGSRSLYRSTPVTSSRRSSSSRTRSSFDYGKDDTPRVRIETIPGRRNSYYEDKPVRSSTYEDKYRDAAGYQDGVGGPTIELTAEALKRQAQRSGTSSRSTRSTESQDESDFKRSATTRTTRSSFDQDADDMTIRFKGKAKVNIGGAEITCEDGAEVNFVRRPSIRNGSDRSGSDYRPSIDSRRSRDSRASNYSRSTSQSVRPSSINSWF